MPKRIQRKRTKGWQMPPNTIYVGRVVLGGGETAGSLNTYGNWHVIGESGDAQQCVDKYERDVLEWRTEHPEAFEKWIARLCGKDLACWCPLNQPCHADILLKLANPEVQNAQ